MPFLRGKDLAVLFLRGAPVGILNDLLLVLSTRREVYLMGITYIEGVVTGPAGKQVTVRFLADSGATYTSTFQGRRS